nr:reverse transcriptase domain-containing protein [Tanacetum cinerariifolium]
MYSERSRTRASYYRCSCINGRKSYNEGATPSTHEGYGEAIVILEINVDHFEIKTNLLQLVQANPYHGFERKNPHTHINNFKMITSTLRFRDVSNDVIKLMMFLYSLEENARVWENSSKMDDMIDKLADQISTLVDIFAKKVVTPAPVKANQSSTLGTLPSNTIPNPKGEMKAITARSGVVYKGPSTPNPKKTLPKPNIPYPSRLNDQKLRKKATNQIEKFFQIYQDFHFDISFADALLLMPKFASMITSLLTNKDKLFELVKIPLNENFSVMLLKKLPKKLGDPGKFLIPCDLPGIDVCHSLADLGASINLMPLSIWKNISLPKLTPTRMNLELADRSITRPKGVAEDVFVKVGKFYFLTDFVVVYFEADPRVPLILGRSFLRIGRALIDVYGEEITLRVNDEAVTFNLNQTTRYSSAYDDLSVNRIDIIDVAREEYAQEILGFFNNYLGGNPTSTSEPILPDSSPSLTPLEGRNSWFFNNYFGGNPTSTSEPILPDSSPSLTPLEGSDFILEEIEAYLKDESISPKINLANCDPEGDICLIEKLLNNDPFQLPPVDLKQGEVVKAKSSIEEPPESELKDLSSHLEYAYLEGVDKLPSLQANIINKVKNQLPKFLPKVASDFATPKIKSTVQKHSDLYNGLLNSIMLDEAIASRDVNPDKVLRKRHHEDQDPPAGSDKGKKKKMKRNDSEPSKKNDQSGSSPKEIVVRMAGKKEYKFKEADFSRLHLDDIKDMFLLYVQGFVYLTKKNRKKLMRADELFMFCDETLKLAREVLHYRLTNFKLGYNADMPTRAWTD